MSLLSLKTNEKSVLIENELRKLLATLPLKTMAKNNRAYDDFDGDAFEAFVINEKNRFFKVYDLLDKMNLPKASRIADLGTLIPYLPALLGDKHQVTIVERFDLYDQAVQKAVQAFSKNFNLNVLNVDILGQNLPSIGQFDVIFLMAVVEHLNGSPKDLLQNIHKMLTGPKLFVFEVPNIAELGRRLSFLLGKSPLPQYEKYFISDYPFYGHNREMTVDEVRFLMKAVGFEILHLECYDYLILNQGLKQKILNLFKKIFQKFGVYQSILVVAKAI